MLNQLSISIIVQLLTNQGAVGEFYALWKLEAILLQYKTERDGLIETRIERKMVITSDVDDIDHDEVGCICYSQTVFLTMIYVLLQALAEAIRSVTDMNPDLSVEKIEIKTESDGTIVE